LLVAVAGFAAPLIYVSLLRKVRIQSLCQQLPEAFELMSRAVKAGQTMPGAMNLVATQLKPPISLEFASCCEQQNLGLSHDIALQELARRTGVMELQLFVVAMLVQRHAGGNPIEPPSGQRLSRGRAVSAALEIRASVAPACRATSPKLASFEICRLTVE